MKTSQEERRVPWYGGGRELRTSRRALYAAATIHAATILTLLACFPLPLHAVGA